MDMVVMKSNNLFTYSDGLMNIPISPELKIFVVAVTVPEVEPKFINSNGITHSRGELFIAWRDLTR